MNTPLRYRKSIFIYKLSRKSFAFDFKSRLKTKEEQPFSSLGSSNDISTILKEITVNIPHLITAQKDKHIKINSENVFEYDLNNKLNDRLFLFKFNDINDINDTEKIKTKQQEDSSVSISIGNELLSKLNKDSSIKELLEKYYEGYCNDSNSIEAKHLSQVLDDIEGKLQDKSERILHLYLTFIEVILNNIKDKDELYDIADSLIVRLLIKFKNYEIDIDSIDKAYSHFIQFYRLLRHDFRHEQLHSSLREMLNLSKKEAYKIDIANLINRVCSNKVDDISFVKIIENLHNMNKESSDEKTEVNRLIVSYYYNLFKQTEEKSTLFNDEEVFVYPEINKQNFEKTYEGFIEQVMLIESKSEIENHPMKSLLDVIKAEIYYTYGSYLYSQRLFKDSIKYLTLLSELDQYDSISYSAQKLIKIVEADKSIKYLNMVKKLTPTDIKVKVLNNLAESYDNQLSYRIAFNYSYKALMSTSKNNQKHLLNDELALNYHIKRYLYKHLKYSYLFNKGFKTNYTKEEFGLLINILYYALFNRKDYTLSHKIYEKLTSVNDKMNFLNSGLISIQVPIMKKKSPDNRFFNSLIIPLGSG